MSLPERRHPLRPLFGKKTKAKAAPKRETVKAEEKPAKKTTAKKATKKASK